jgi:ribonuclease T1
MITMPPGADAQEQQAITDAVGLIDTKGPFAYQRDGIKFKNREAKLPAQPAGHYREYTVASSGVTGRGARRIVHGATGELFYSPDHYTSFIQLR